ncbi:hypothetical protein RYX45_22355, partial [Alkalihalophilus pseudofirmus]
PNLRTARGHLVNQIIGELNRRTTRSTIQNHSAFHAFVSTIEPKTIDEALKDEDWVLAMQEELNQFVRNDVWDLVPCHSGQTIIGTKWVLC